MFPIEALKELAGLVAFGCAAFLAFAVLCLCACAAMFGAMGVVDVWNDLHEKWTRMRENVGKRQQRSSTPR